MGLKEFLVPNDSKFSYFLFYLLFPPVFSVIGCLLNILVIPMIITIPVMLMLMVYFSASKYYISIPLLLAVSYYTACLTDRYKQKGLRKPYKRGIVVFLCITFVLAIVVYAYNGTFGVSCSKDADCTSATEGQFCTYPANRYLNYDMLNPMAYMPLMSDCFTSPVPACVNKRCTVSDLDVDECTGFKGFRAYLAHADRETGDFSFSLSSDGLQRRRIDAVKVSLEGILCQDKEFSGMDIDRVGNYQINASGCVIPEKIDWGAAHIEISYRDTVPGPNSISAGDCAYDVK